MADPKPPSRKVLLIGWDAADWKSITPLMEAGKMPHLSHLVCTGCTAGITTLQPSLSPMLWTSIATGKRPFHHGVHGFTEPRADGRGVQRVTNLSRKCKALWNILGQSGMRSIVVGWWPSYPAEPISGAMVSDQFSRVSSEFKLVPWMVYPPEFGEPLAGLRLNPEDIPAEVLELFVPHAREIDQERDRRLYAAARIIAECANIQTAATWLMEREPWNLCAVYFDAIDHFGHGFMKFKPPRQTQVREEDFDLYRNVLDAGYQLHDKMLGTLLDQAGEDATAILLSDHGFHPDHLRAAFIPQFHAGPASEHRNNGMFVISGPGIRRGFELPGVTLLDIAPTVLTLLDLPAGADMEGRILSDAFDRFAAPERIPSWDKVEGDDGRHPPHMQLDVMAAAESLDQLVALGYVEQPDQDDDKAVKQTVADLRTNLAEAYQDAGRHEEAAGILRELRDNDVNDQRVALRLFLSAQALGETAEMADIAGDWSERRRQVYVQGLARVNELRAIARKEARDAERDAAAPLLDQEQRAELKQLRRLCRYDPSVAVYFRAQILRDYRRWKDALACLDEIPAADLIRPGLFTDRAELLGRLNRWPEADILLAEARAIDSSDARVHFLLARSALHRNDFRAAANAALDGLALLDRDPRGHYLLGIALTGLKFYEDAAVAFLRALGVNPNFPRAHLWLARVYRRWLAAPPSAVTHSRRYRELTNRKKLPVTGEFRTAVPAPRPVAFSASARELPPLGNETVIVSGLPRSGTSMIMQMLAAGGLAALTDRIRQPDEDNPRGYFEFEPIKNMAQDVSWMDESRGKVVKIVAPMIPNLPDGLPCRVILIERDFDDILASQRQMIERRGRTVDQTPARLKRLKQEYLRLIIRTKGFLASRPGTNLMCVDRNAILRDPLAAARMFNRFLGGNLNEVLMAAEVRPELDRQRSHQ